MMSTWRRTVTSDVMEILEYRNVRLHCSVIQQGDTIILERVTEDDHQRKTKYLDCLMDEKEQAKLSQGI